MVAIYSNSHVFQHPFDNVTSAFWRKYPNDQASHVKSIDCYSRKIDSSGRLIVHRLLRCESPVPSWMATLGVSNAAYAAETAVIDPHTKEMCIKSRNITGASMMVVEETCTYTENESNKQYTSFTQQARIKAFLPFFSKRAEQFTHTSMCEKAPLGLQVIESLCEKIKSRGILQFIDDLLPSFDLQSPLLPSFNDPTTPSTLSE